MVNHLEGTTPTITTELRPLRRLPIISRLRKLRVKTMEMRQVLRSMATSHHFCYQAFKNLIWSAGRPNSMHKPKACMDIRMIKLYSSTRTLRCQQQERVIHTRCCLGRTTT